MPRATPIRREKVIDGRGNIVELAIWKVPPTGRDMARTLTIEIKSTEDALQDFRRTFKALEAGRRVARHEGVYFTSIEAARNLLTRNRLALLRAIRARHPGSIYELAKTVKRDLKNVQQDLRILEEYGLIRMTPARRAGNRRVKVPEAPFDEIALRIAI